VIVYSLKIRIIVDIEVNVLDATGDRILAGEELTKEDVFTYINVSHFRRVFQHLIMRN
jgi:hypothetical protein